MKTTKRVIAIVLAALMLAMMIPMTASAATSSFTLKCDRKGFEFSIYPLATIDDTTGAITATSNVTDAAVLAEINASKASTQDLLDLCKASTGLGTATDVFKSADNATQQYTKTNGIYFVKCTKMPLNGKEVLRDSIVVLPLPDDTYTDGVVDLTDKVSVLGEPTVVKDFKVGDSLTRNPQTFGTGDTITYVLTADVTGSADNHLTDYAISDTMGKGLDKSKITVKSVVLKNGNDETPLVYTLKEAKDFTTADTELVGSNKTFAVFVDAKALAENSFYTAGNKVVVTYETQLAADAPIATDIPNQDFLAWRNASGKNSKNGNTVNAKTYKIVAKKIDAQTNQPVAGAEFTLTYPDGTTKKVATSGTDGIADFGVLLKAGAYTVQETKEPNGYTINTKVETVTVGDATTGTVTVTISDTKTKTPKTGGAGTMMFTIIGGSLVLLAGALFVVVMKKRSSK